MVNIIKEINGCSDALLICRFFQFKIHLHNGELYPSKKGFPGEEPLNRQAVGMIYCYFKRHSKNIRFVVVIGVVSQELNSGKW